jgi:hypothetical protein
VGATKADDHPDLRGGNHYVDSPRHANYVKVELFPELLADIRWLQPGEIFYSLDEVRIVTDWRREHHNRARPCRSFGYRPLAWEAMRMGAGRLGPLPLRLPRRRALAAHVS